MLAGRITLPVGKISTWFLRQRLEPGADLSPLDHFGTALMMVDAGEVTLTGTASGVTVHTGASWETAPEGIGDGIRLGPGNGVLVEDGATISIRNDGEDAASVLLLDVYNQSSVPDYRWPSDRPASGVEVQAVGYTHQLLIAQGPAILVLEHDIVPGGGSGYSSTFEGIEIGGIDAGRARIGVQRGTTWVTPQLLETWERIVVPGAKQVSEGEHTTLSASDGYAAQDAALTWRAGDDGPLEILRAQVIPVPVPA